MKAGYGWWSLALAAAGAALGFVSGPAQAAPCLVSSPSSGYIGCSYVQGRLPVIYTFPAGPVIQLEGLRLRDPVPPPGPPGPPPPLIDSFFDVFVTIDLGPAIPYSGMAPAMTDPSLWELPVPTGAPIPFFIPIELVQLQLLGLPPQMVLREHPVLPSQGATRITDVGGGLFQIDSFFDVFTELSLDGGGTWLPGSNFLRLDLSSSAVPEPGIPALLGLGLAMLLLSRRLVARV